MELEQRSGPFSMRPVLSLIGALSIVVGSFFGTLFLLDVYYPRDPDTIRMNNAKSIMAALEKHFSTKGAYPVVPGFDVLLQELDVSLVKGGFIKAIPSDPSGKPASRYVSFTGKSYGLLLTTQGQGPCLIEVRITQSGFWSQPPPCRL